MYSRMVLLTGSPGNLKYLVSQRVGQNGGFSSPALSGITLAVFGHTDHPFIDSILTSLITVALLTALNASTPSGDLHLLRRMHEHRGHLNDRFDRCSCCCSDSGGDSAVGTLGSGPARVRRRRSLIAIVDHRISVLHPS